MNSKTWRGPQTHLSQTGKGGGRAVCGNKRAHITSSLESFEKENEMDRCLKCYEIHLRISRSIG